MNVRDIILTAFALLVCVSCKKEKEMTLSGLNIRDFQTEVDGSKPPPVLNQVEPSVT